MPLAWEITKTTINKQEKAVLRKGQEAVLTCTADVKVDACSFYGGNDKVNGYRMIEGAHYKDDGIKQTSTGKNDCSMKILELDHTHNGEWRCDITHCGEEDCDDPKSGTIDLIVAKKPSQIYLEGSAKEAKMETPEPESKEPEAEPESEESDVELDNTKIQSSIFMNLTIESQVKVKCVAKGANPHPRFKWFLHDTELSSHVEREENGYYVSELTYEGDLEHNEKTLKCKIEQEGYTEEDISNGENIAQIEMEIVGDPPGSLAMSIGITAAVLALIGLIAGAVYVYMTKFHQSNSNETESIAAEEDFALNPKKEIP